MDKLVFFIFALVLQITCIINEWSQDNKVGVAYFSALAAFQIVFIAIEIVRIIGG